MLQPEFNAVTRVKKVSAETKQSVEVSLPTGEEIKKPVSVCAEAYIISKERGESETSATARVIFNFVYLAEEGYKKAEMTAEVSAKIPLGNAFVTARVEDARIISVSGGYVAKASVIFGGESAKSETKNALAKGEGFFIKEFTEEFDAYTGLSEGSITLEDEFEVNYAVKEVLMHRETANLNEVKSGISAIIFDGEAIVDFSLLPINENGDIIREKRVIPFRHEMESVGALPDMRAYGNAEIKRVAVKVSADEGKGKSTISTEIVVGFSGEAAETVSVTLVGDAYSKTNLLSLKREKTDIVRFNGQYVYAEKVITSASGEVPEGGRAVAALGEDLSIISCSGVGGKVKVVGTAYADVVFKNADNGTTSVSAEAPFDIETDVVGTANIVKITLTDFSARVRSGGIEFEFTVKVVYRLYEEKETSIIAEIEEGEKRPLETSSITVYLPTGGEGVWDIAKKLGESEEDIKKFNPSLEFPLSSKDRIIIYRQKN